MKRALLLLLALAVVGALLVPIGASDPPTVVVKRGDTLGGLAKTAGVSVAELREWNGIDGDLIQVGQELATGPSGAGKPAWMVLRERFAASEAAVVEDDVAEAKPPPVRRRRPRAKAQPGAEAPEQFIEEEATSWPPLKPPAPKECLDAFAGADGVGDRAFGRSEGLSGAQVKAGVAAFQQQTLRCADGHDSIAGQLLVELTIGCDGRVMEADVLDDGTPADGFADCVAQVLTFASFPAHARDSVTIQIPLAYVD